MAPPAKKRKGSSRAVRAITIAPPIGYEGNAKGVGQTTSRLLFAEAREAEKRDSAAQVQQMLSGLSDEAKKLLQDGTFDVRGIDGDSDAEDRGMDTNQDGWEDLPDIMQDDVAFIHAIREVSSLQRKGRFNKAKQPWKQRRQRAESEWNALLPLLADCYLEWLSQSEVGHPRHDGSDNIQHLPSEAQDPVSVPSPSRDSSQGSAEEAHSASPSEPATAPLPVDEDQSSSYMWPVKTYDIFTLVPTVTVRRSADSSSPALDLLVHGWIAKSPVNPTVAVSIKTLQLLHRLRQRKASFSVEAFAKVVSDYYKIPYRSHLRTVVADTYEIYLRIIRIVEQRVHNALGWLGEDWRVLNACRACCYKLDSEPDLRFSRLYAFDGNNSLKRMRLIEERIAGDTRVLDDSSYFLSPEYVDRFSHEVRGQKGPLVRVRSDESDSNDDEADDNASVEGDPTDGLAGSVPGSGTGPTSGDQATSSAATPEVSESELLAQKLMEGCVKNWKANSSEEKKKMWAIFDEAGVFVAACRHGMILWIIDMIRSGELAKYPLAIVAKVLDIMEPKALAGYDIGCSFETTVKRSSLGQQFEEKGGRVCVNAFHGYTHCYPCQLSYHPNVIEGAGLEDFETLERVFSGSNQLASITRHASPFRRRLYIEAYFKQWDDDKYLNSGTFIYNNYIQALNILDKDAEALRNVMASQNISEDDLKEWEREELRFFATLGQGEPYDIRKVAYVELLQELRELDSRVRQSAFQFLTYDPTNAAVTNYAKQVSGTNKLESERRHARAKYDRVALEICDLELVLNIPEGQRWTPASREYQETVKYIQERKYRRALDKLQRLVIQRLFELHKLNLAQTGYKLRTHLSKSLQTRCKTIRKAVTAYNTAAAALNPPRPPLDWSKVTHYNFLEDFNLLQDTRNDIRGKRWCEPVVREAMKVRRRISRAKEEIKRCNVEVRRLHTALVDEEQLFTAALERVKDSTLACAVQDFAVRRSKVNAQLLKRIHQIYDLDGFTGVRGPGVRLGMAQLPTDVPGGNEMPRPVAGDGEAADEENTDSLDNTEEEGDIGGLIQYVTHL